MRTLAPQEPELVRLCHSKTWDAVHSRSQSHPYEAQPSEASLRGEGSTALAAAVRSGAPQKVLEALLGANVHQVGITHRNRGSVLHEALKHRVSDDVIQYLLRTMIQYQKTSFSMHRRLDIDRVQSVCLQFTLNPVQVQDRRLLVCPNLLSVVDDMGRSALHYFVEKLKLVAGNFRRIESTWGLFQALLLAYPAAVQMKDSDGNTPLMLLLVSPRGASCGQLENSICRMIHLMLSVCPEAAMVTRKMPRPWRFQPLPSPFSGRHFHDGSPTPLYYAILNGRNLETVQLLLDVSKKLGRPGSTEIVTQYHEVALHIAVTTRAPLSIIYQIIQDNAGGVLVQDVYGLTPIDWLWVRHVLDWHANPADFVSSRIISRRRFLANEFLEWHEQASRNMPLTDPSFLPANPVAIRGLQEELLQRMKLLLPLAASTSAAEPTFKTGEPWSLLHATCFLPCPVALVRAALSLDSQSITMIRSKDLRAGRYPLHYAASRLGYSATFPVGVSRGIRTLRERPTIAEILPLFPEASRSRDRSGQLPLHIAIDAAKHTRLMSKPLADDGIEILNQELSIIQMLLGCYPAAIECRDGRTCLFPWQQAAVGAGASLDAIYKLLRLHPTSIHTVL